MTAPRNLTEPFIRSLGPAPAGKRVAYSDALVPGLRVRVTDTGTKALSFGVVSAAPSTMRRERLARLANYR